MAFTPHDHEYYTSHGVFSNEFINSSLVTTTNPPLPQICNSQITPTSSLYEHNINEQLVNINSLAHYVPPSISMMPWFPERLGVSDMTVPVLLPASSNSSDYSTNTHQIYAVDKYNNNNNNNNGCNGQHHEGCESWDENTDHGFESNFWSSCPSNNWGAQRETSPKIKETPAMKIGRYSEEERKDRILRYLKKRNQRNFNKTIKYACRKTLADKRVRVRGRFAKNNEACDDHEVLIKGDKDVCYDHNPQIQMKHGDHYNDQENWLEEAITNFMYIPYIGSSYDGNFIS